MIFTVTPPISILLIYIRKIKIEPNHTIKYPLLLIVTMMKNQPNMDYLDILLDNYEASVASIKPVKVDYKKNETNEIYSNKDN